MVRKTRVDLTATTAAKDGTDGGALVIGDDLGRTWGFPESRATREGSARVQNETPFSQILLLPEAVDDYVDDGLAASRT
jgi:hypothetical protein